MTNRLVVVLKIVVFPACLVPLGWLVYHGFTSSLGPDPVATITHTTGYWTLYFLLISLAVTPVRRLSSRLVWLIRFRRMFGLFAFFYGTLHLTTYVWLFSNFDVHHDGHVGMGLFIPLGGHLHHLVNSQTGRQALDDTASPGLCRRHRRRHPLLVDCEDWRANAVESYSRAGSAAVGASSLVGKGNCTQTNSRSHCLDVSAQFDDSSNRFIGGAMQWARPVFG